MNKRPLVTCHGGILREQQAHWVLHRHAALDHEVLDPASVVQDSCLGGLLVDHRHLDVCNIVAGKC